MSNYFALEMAAIVVARRRRRREQRARGRMERIFSTWIHLFGMPVEHIIWTYRLPSHVIFKWLQEIKDDLEPSTRSHATPGLSKLLANLHFLTSGSFNVIWLLYFSFATMLICAALDIVCWTICKWHVASVFFNLHIVSKPIGAVLELRSRTNLPCLVKLYDIRQHFWC